MTEPDLKSSPEPDPAPDPEADRGPDPEADRGPEPGAGHGPGPAADFKADLRRYLQYARDALVWKLHGLSEYDVRRPLTPTGTNLLGLVKHATGVELGYLGETFGRSAPGVRPWAAGEGDDAEPNADMWATADESREQIVTDYRSAWAHADATIEALSLDTTGHVPWWPEGRDEVTLHHALVRVTADTHRHAGHADIVRELIDGAVGMNEGNESVPPGDPAWWADHRTRLQRTAERFPGGRAE